MTPPWHCLPIRLPTGAILVVLITILGPISGAHFNPAVSMVFAVQAANSRGAIAGLYILVQIAGGIAGTLAAQPCSPSHLWNFR